LQTKGRSGGDARRGWHPRIVCSLEKRYRKMLVKFDPPLGELYWTIDKQTPQDY